MIDISNNNIADALVGSVPIKKVCVGNDVVWEKSSPVLPYDAQVEYLQSTGTQYIQLPLNVPAGSYFEVEFDVIIDSVYASTSNTLFGANPWRQCQVNYYSKSTTTVSFASYLGNSTGNGGFGTKLGEKTHVIFSTTHTHSYTENEDLTNRLVSRPLSSAITAFRIFRGYRYSNEYPAKIPNFKIKVGDNIVYDLIAVRKDNIGYMYDKISGELHGNAGTNDFLYGNDVI